MAWMSDEAWEYTQDCIDKKKTARSFHNMRTHCGKRGGMKTASDFMTKKELEAMNGEVINYPNMKQPMTWAEFKTLPDDMKVAYITWIRETFGANDVSIAEMLGINRQVLGKHFRCWGLGQGKAAGGRRKWDKEKFLAWSHGADPDAVNEPDEVEVKESVNEAPEATESPVEDSEVSAAVQDITQIINKRIESFEGNSATCEKISATPIAGSMTFECPADQALNMLALVLGDKKVALHVEWTVVE